MRAQRGASAPVPTRTIRSPRAARADEGGPALRGPALRAPGGPGGGGRERLARAHPGVREQPARGLDRAGREAQPRRRVAGVGIEAEPARELEQAAGRVRVGAAREAHRADPGAGGATEPDPLPHARAQRQPRGAERAVREQRGVEPLLAQRAGQRALGPAVLAAAKRAPRLRPGERARDARLCARQRGEPGTHDADDTRARALDRGAEQRQREDEVAERRRLQQQDPHGPPRARRRISAASSGICSSWWPTSWKERAPSTPAPGRRRTFSAVR